MIYELVIAALLAAGLLLFWLRKPRKSASPGPAARAAPRIRTREVIQVPMADAPPPAPPVSLPPVPPILEALQVLRAADLDDAARDRVAAICAAMPEPHPVQTQMAHGLDTPEELLSAVTTDAGLTATILRTVNSAAFGLSTSITSVQHAVTYLGVSVVKGLVAQAALAEHTDASSPEQKLALAHVWRSACIASSMAQLLGKELGFARPSVLATKSLFFNLGDVALIMAVEGLEDAYVAGVGVVERVERQQQLAGLNTAIAGSALARAWSLPTEIEEAIETVLIPLHTPPDDHPMEGDRRRENVLLYLASRIGDRVSYRGLRDIADLPMQDEAEPGTFFLRAHLEAAGLGRACVLLHDPSFRRKANRLIETLAGAG